MPFGCEREPFSGRLAAEESVLDIRWLRKKRSMKTQSKKRLSDKAKSSASTDSIRRKSQSNGAYRAVASKASVRASAELLTRFEKGQSIANLIDFSRGKRVVIK